ncbi:MAG: DUF3990 domain-containing protein, partial [Treponema sp.]|nr:DUF3990 domain-containing protein [Treponema sp.]
WFDFIMANRRNIYKGRIYDIVYGPVANDTIYNTLIAFETGVLSKKETLVRLKVRKLYNQMTFKTERALSFLRYTGFLGVFPKIRSGADKASWHSRSFLPNRVYF